MIMKFKVVFLEKWVVRSFILSDRRSFLEYIKRKGYTQTGVLRGVQFRKEIQGEPTFEELAGPMYDGPGEPIRWVTWEVYDGNLSEGDGVAHWCKEDEPPTVGG